MKENQEDCIELAERIARLLVPVVETLQGQDNTDVDPRLKADLLRFNVYVSIRFFGHLIFSLYGILLYSDLEKILRVVKSQANRSKFSRGVNHIGDSENIAKCKDLVDQGFKVFNVGILTNSLLWIPF